MHRGAALAPEFLGDSKADRGRSLCEMEKREGSSCGFKKETVNKLLQHYFKDDKTQVNDDALSLVAELLKVFVREAAARGARQAQAEDLTKVDVEHVEKVLPQLLLDF